MKLTQKIMSGILLTLTLLGCSNNISPNSVTKNEINITQSNNSEPTYVAKVSENQGASISFKINSPVSGSFNTKANTNGTIAKTATDVDHYLVYLIKDTATGSYAGTDPLNTSNIVAGPFTISNSGAASKLVRFTNIPALATGSSYYVAVRAQDSLNNDLIKVNNGSATAWTVTTAATPFNGKVAVSSGNGVTVDSSYAVSTNAPDVSINLLDAVGATVESTLTPTSGGTPAPVTATAVVL